MRPTWTMPGSEIKANAKTVQTERTFGRSIWRISLGAGMWMLAGERAHEGAAPSVRIPRLAETRTAIGIGYGDRGHGVRNRSERRVERNLVPAHVIFVAQRTGLNGGELAGAQQGDAVAL